MSIAMTKIDWLRFSIPVAQPITGSSDNTFKHVMKLIHLAIGDVWSPIFRTGEWQLQHGVGVYQNARMNVEHKVNVRWGDVNACIDVDCSGISCESVRSTGCFYEIFQEEGMRPSRIDLACDFECNHDVSEIIGKGYKTSFKRSKVERSPQGDTTDIGSRKSERMLRVYRYHPPHPRSKLLRFEVEIKGSIAKTIAREISAASCAEVCLSALKTFGLKHTLVSDAVAVASALPSRPYDKAGAGYMRWLMTQVLPSLVSAHQRGDIDARDWFETHVLAAIS